MTPAHVDLAILPLLTRAQTAGLPVDLEYFAALSTFLADHQADLESRLRFATGREMNANSSDQVGEYLFAPQWEGGLNLPVIKRTGTGKASTVDKYLQALKALASEDGARGIDGILDVREVKKLRGTYVDTMPGFVNPATGRLHPTLLLTRTDTGRLAAKNPNVLAFPKHSALGLLVRHGIVAPEGREFGEWDYSQIEMRAMAEDSGDERMIAEICSGEDKHTATARMIFQKTEVSKEERFAAKAVNFGILMGITEHGLRDQFHKNGQTHWTVADTRDLLETWMRGYPQCAAYIRGKHAEARRFGYVTDMWGRQRWVQAVQSPNPWIREGAERQAQATPIQSGAQGLIKRAMVALAPVLEDIRRETGAYVELLLQVHDALMFEYDVEVRDVVDQAVRWTMETVATWRVPIVAEGSRGATWGEL